jgi:hypothetical protein
MARICDVDGCLMPGVLFDPSVVEQEDEASAFYLCKAHEDLVVEHDYDLADYPYPDAPPKVLVLKRKEEVDDVTAKKKRERDDYEVVVDIDAEAEAEAALKEQQQLEEEEKERDRKKQVTV